MAKSQEPTTTVDPTEAAHLALVAQLYELVALDVMVRIAELREARLARLKALSGGDKMAAAVLGLPAPK
jgi:hypothetical protein